MFRYFILLRQPDGTFNVFLTTTEWSAVAAAVNGLTDPDVENHYDDDDVVITREVFA